MLILWLTNKTDNLIEVQPKSK